MDKLHQEARDLGAQFADFMNHPGAGRWTLLLNRMAAYQMEWTKVDELAQAARQQARTDARMLHEYQA